MTISAKTSESGVTVVDVGANGVVQFQWATGVDAQLVRGSGANVGRTAIALRRTDGTRIYLSVDTGTTLVVSATAP
jgi:L-ascorbate metabolism protein UlaG (beta-lactamase superfamily)